MALRTPSPRQAPEKADATQLGPLMRSGSEREPIELGAQKISNHWT